MKKEKQKVEEIFIPKSNIKKEIKKDFLNVLKMFAPGTSIRSALDDLLRANMGALIVFDKIGRAHV